MHATWYFDVISPFAYLHFTQFHRLPGDLAIDCRPVLFAGLLKHWGTKGPAELPAKRVHTYQQCVWFARELGVPFTMPPRHPFNPLRLLRLLIALGATRERVGSVLGFVWADGLDPEHDWPELCTRLGVAPDTPVIDEPAVKQHLVDNTAEAVARGVWGVPTFDVNGALFWGLDTLSWMNAFLASPDLFDGPDMRRAATAGVAAERKIPPP